jgi:hypothetical protein
MPHTVTVGSHPNHPQLVVTHPEFANVMGLAPAARIEHRAIQQDPIVVPVCAHHSRVH